MAKRKKSRKKAKVENTAEHALPGGFWPQVGALCMLAISVLLVMTWFHAGGNILQWLGDATSWLIGYAMFLLPLLLVFLAVKIFRSEENRIPTIVVIASILVVLWFAGLFGVFVLTLNGHSAGGMVGELLNKLVLAVVDRSVAAFLYVLLVLITVLFILSVSPATLFKKIGASLRSAKIDSEDEKNAKVMQKNESTSDKTSGLKLNKGVPTMDSTDSKNKKPIVNEAPTAALVSVSDPNWQTPPLDLLEKHQSPADAGDIQQNADIIKNTLSEFNIAVQMEGANIGPKVTQYTLRPPSGVKLTRITALETNLALNLAASSLRIEAPIPGQKAVGIEVPNIKAADVRLYSILESDKWEKATDPLSFGIGRDISGEAMIGQLGKMPHLLIAGQTGSGKSVMINTLLTSMLYHNSPSDMKLILVDPKRVEMTPYDDIPHLLTPIITEPEKTVSALKWAVGEMERRYHLLAEEKARDIDGYNRKVATKGKKVEVTDEDGNIQEHDNGKMPYIVIVVDELSDLMMAAGRDVEALVVRLAQKARAVGVHLVLATQRPSVDVITGLIKANIPARIAFTVASQVDSRTILDQIGAEKLLGQGDMLMQTPDMSKPKRVQGALVTDDEVMRVTDFLREQSPPQYNDEVVAQEVNLNGRGGVVMSFSGDDDDDMFRDAVQVVIDSRKASASLLQRRLRIGYARAARLIESMEDRGIIGPADGARARDVLIDNIDDIE
ncbi:DNA translocase FtsK 4TM domain-containing protein [Candidatus Saccharibacteria bacterium]|nr:DNA translocase FtsK 4TM domain-containing protein [Candidatus Saccharibacteria bacterium]